VNAIRLRFLVFIFSIGLTSDALAQSSPLLIRQTHVDFGKAVRGAVLEHAFALVNENDSLVRIKKVRLTPPLLPGSMPVEIRAHQETILRVKLDTSTVAAGVYEGTVTLSFDDLTVPDAVWTVTAHIVPPIEVTPPALFAIAQRGEEKQVSAEIVNHESDRVMIGPPRSTPGRFTTTLETLEEGRRYRLTLTLDPRGPGGKKTEPILLKTSSATVPELKITAYTYLQERVYTFPDIVELGGLRLEDIRRSPEVLRSAAQTLMIYRKGTSDFQVSVSSDLSELAISAERGPLGDRFQVTISLKPERLKPGKISGNIIVETNDPEFPKLTVPVSGEILGPTGGS
jgi:hypothetical protein